MSRSVGTDNLKPDFHLRLLGPSSLTDAAGALVPGMGPGKPLAMLAYLVFQQSVRRDELVALLWGEVSEAKARNAFRQTLHRLRSALGEEMLPAMQEHVVLRAGDALWCDALAFQDAIAAGDVDQAIALYQGKFLEGLDLREEGFSDWVEARRHKFAAAYEGALSRAAERALDGGDWRLAVQRAQALTRLAPLDSHAALLEATALLAGGRRAEAITALTVHSQRIQEELGTKAPAAVSSLLQSVLSSSPASRDRDATEPGGNPPRLRQPEFVGRETELARLLAAWRRASNGEGSGILIVGEAGSGKSRFVSEFLERAPSIAPPLTLSGQERATAVSVPYASIAEALRPALNAPGLSGASQHLLSEAARLLPELRDQFDLPQPLELGDDTERVRFFEGIAALIDAVAYEQPVCLILEDLHYAAGPTVELVRYLGRRLQKSPVLIIATWSGNGLPESRSSAEGFERIEIAPLSLAESERLIASVLETADVSADDQRRLAGLSAGAPFRALELAERAREGDIAPALPVTIRDVLWRRLQQCDPHEQRLFVAAALFTQAVSIRLLAAAAHVSESAALEGVLSLERRGLLIQRDGRMTPANAAAAELALHSTGAAGVALLAGWAADALAAERPSAAGELARLYSLAERKPAAYRFARAAALDAVACGAYHEAERFLSLAGASCSTELERAEVAALARSIAGGPRLLPAGAVAAIRDDEPVAPRDEPADPVAQPEAAADAPRPQPVPRARWSRWRVRPWLAAAGVATIGATALVVRAGLEERADIRGSVMTDTLVLAERLNPRDVRYYHATGPVSENIRRAPATWAPFGSERRPDLLALPWVNAIASPDGRMIAVERVSPAGVDVYVIDAVAGDTTPVAVGGGDHIAESWSPDGSRLLVISGRTLPDGAYDSDLFAYAARAGGARIALDTGAARSVTQARWSPRGTDVAWVARDAGTMQQDVFAAQANGGGARNLSSHAAEDYDLAWSADGERVAFTSERDGNAEIYSAELATGQLRRMTFHTAQDSRPAFSPDGQFLAFESVRSGRLEAYVMAAFAGAPRPLAGVRTRLEIIDWKGRPPPFLNGVTIRASATLEPGDSVTATAEATDQYGNELEIRGVRWFSLDPNVVRVRANGDSIPGQALLLASRPGIARLVADAGGWRADTAVIQVGVGSVGAVSDRFESAALQSFWIPLGSPKSYTAAGIGRSGTRGLVPNGDSRWESGVLSATAIQLRAGLTAEAWVRAPLADVRPGGRSFSMSLVAPGPRTPLDSISPQLLRLASITWLGDAARISYSTEGEVRGESVRALGPGNQHVFRIVVEPSGRAAFYVDGKLRWRSNVSLLSGIDERRVQLWLGSRGAGTAVVMDDVSATAGPARGSAPANRDSER